MFMQLLAEGERYGSSLIESKSQQGSFTMRKFIMALSAASLMIPASMAVPVSGAQAKRHYTPRVYTRNGHTYCRHSDGTTGLIVGGVGGAVVGSSIAGRGNGTLGAILGGVGGALGGRAIDRSMTAKKRCR
jgi:hypothetical protein